MLDKVDGVVALLGQTATMTDNDCTEAEGSTVAPLTVVRCMEQQVS